MAGAFYYGLTGSKRFRSVYGARFRESKLHIAKLHANMRVTVLLNNSATAVTLLVCALIEVPVKQT